MFVRVTQKDNGFHFTVVDILSADVEQELDLIVDLGVIQTCHLNSEQAWYIIAENLIASDLADNQKCTLARDIANWLPPLSREGLIQARAEDLRQLSALYTEGSLEAPAIPVELSENDPLMIIADWLDGN